MKRLVLFTALVSLFCFPAHGAGPKNLGKFDYWQTYLLYEGKNPVCYMSLTAKPPSKKGVKNKRGNVVLMIVHRPAESAFDVLSYSIGTKFKPSSDVTVKTGEKVFSLFTKEDTAWTRDSAMDQALTYAIRKELSAIFTGQTYTGEKIADEVNLKGSDKAYRTISKACSAPLKK